MHGKKSLIELYKLWTLAVLFLNKILKKEPVELNEKSVNKCKDFLDSFDKDLIRGVVLGIVAHCHSFFQTKLVSFGRWVVLSSLVWKKNKIAH